MAKTLAGVLAVSMAALLFAGCGGSDSISNPTTSGAPSTTQAVTTSTQRDDYAKYLELTAQLGGKVIPKDDAPIRAALLCNGSAKSMLGGVSITNFPTDLALIRAYCPDKESIYG
jgi:hypothetical protein